MSLHIYTVHTNPASLAPYEAAQFVEEGFNGKAFVFGVLWMLYNRLWGYALGLFACNICIVMLSSSGLFTAVGITVIDLALRLLVGSYANDLRRARLQNEGYITADIVSGDSLLRGQQRFFDRYFATRPIAPFAG